MVRLSVLIGSVVLSLILNYIFIKIANKRHWFILGIRERDSHKLPTPRVGGIAIALTFLMMIVGLSVVYPNYFHFSGSYILGIDRNLFGFVSACILLLVVNLIDDFKGLPWSVKLVAQIIASLIVLYFGIGIDCLTSPLGGEILLGGMAGVFVVLWLVLISNAINWLDGLDGLAGGVCTIALVIIYFLSTSDLVRQESNAILTLIMLGAVIGFLPYNLVRAKSFLGDSGAVLIGFVIGVLAIISGGKVATAFLALAVPFLDAVSVIIYRLAKGMSPFHADRRHLFHRLLDRGLSKTQILLIFYFLSAMFGAVALLTQTRGKAIAVIATIVLMGILSVYSFKKRKSAIVE